MLRFVALALAALFLARPALAAPEINAPAPEFELVASDGKIHRLSDYRGRVVVLEWTNHLCPFVQKHYETGNMQKTQRHAESLGAAWLTIISSAPGKQGHVSGEEADRLTKERDAAPTAVLLDEEGIVGKLYGARTTPHMYVIDEKGILRYMGGIDDKPTTRHEDVNTAQNYVIAALDGWTTKKEVPVAATPPYGCSIKYK
ncbi:MAG TPA: redoxin domain-containing protein [Sphingomonadales bacterium]